MKKFFLVSLVLITFFSCSLDDDMEDKYALEFVPIESVIMPNELWYGEVYTITYSYKRPTTCHSFNNLYYLPQGDYRTVAVVNKVLIDNSITCEDLDDEVIEGSFKFYCSKSFGEFVFKFWNGKDDDGNDTYLTYTYQVNN